MLFVDTEEEFDWSAPFDRSATRVRHVGGLSAAQARFRAADVRPVYLCDHAIVHDPLACDAISGWRAAGEADVGAHLHPWITPPHEELVSGENSFAGNLPEALERAKLTALTADIAARLGGHPLVYRAGRYGAGPNTARILSELGYRLDCSVRARFDYSRDGGPDYARHPLNPYWIGPERTLAVLPLSTAYTGAARAGGAALFGMARRVPLASAVLARTGLLQRVPLTPEGTRPAEALAAIDALLAEDVPVLSLSFHSPTLEPGNTPYVRDAADLAAFWRWWDAVLGHLARRGVAPMALPEFLAILASERGDQACQAA